MFSFIEFARTMALGATVAWILYSFGLFQTHYFWGSVFVVASTMDAHSPAVHNFAQYVFPVYLTLQIFATGDYPSILQLAMLVPTYLFLVGIPMSICLHRYFAHAAFCTSRLFQLVLGIVSCFAYQGGCLWWAAKHCRHHHFCDQPNDPHSVIQQGYFYAFVGWTMNPKNTLNRDYCFNNPTLFVPELFFLDTFYHLPPAILFTLVEAKLGRPFVVYSVFGPMLLCRLVTLLFNVEYHPADDSSRCKSINMSQLLADLVGESEHETHHRKPALVKRGNLDIPCEYGCR